MSQHHIAVIATLFFLAPMLYVLHSEAQQLRKGGQSRLGLLFSNQARSAFLSSGLGKNLGGSLLIRTSICFGMLIIASDLSQYHRYSVIGLFLLAASICTFAWLNILKLKSQRLTRIASLLLPAAWVNLLSLFVAQDYHQSFVTLTVATLIMMALEFLGYLSWFLKEKLAHQTKKNG